MNSQTPMPVGSWGYANEEVSSFTRSACEHLELAIQIMSEPHTQVEGIDVLLALKDAESSLHWAIEEYKYSGR